MKKLFILCFITVTILNANSNVKKTSIGCVEKKDFKELRDIDKTQGKISLKKIYKYAFEHNCEVIHPSDTLKIIGKPNKDGFVNIYLEKVDKYLYIKTSTLQNAFTEENNYLNKSF